MFVSVHSRRVIYFSVHTRLATKLGIFITSVFLAFPDFCIFVLAQVIVPLASYRPPSSPTKQDNNNGLACCRADLVNICKDIADRDIRKQVSSIKTDSENKCRVDLHRMKASSLSGKPQFSW